MLLKMFEAKAIKRFVIDELKRAKLLTLKYKEVFIIQIFIM